MLKISGGAVVALLLAQGLAAQNQPNFSDLTRQFISVNAPVLELEHVRVIDGPGVPSPKIKPLSSKMARFDR